MASNLPCPIRHNVLKWLKSSASPIETYIEIKEKLKRLPTLVSALYQVREGFKVKNKKRGETSTPWSRPPAPCWHEQLCIFPWKNVPNPTFSFEESVGCLEMVL